MYGIRASADECAGVAEGSEPLHRYAAFRMTTEKRQPLVDGVTPRERFS
jgi:hypothetical protein